MQEWYDAIIAKPRQDQKQELNDLFASKFSRAKWDQGKAALRWMGFEKTAAVSRGGGTALSRWRGDVIQGIPSTKSDIVAAERQAEVVAWFATTIDDSLLQNQALQFLRDILRLKTPQERSGPLGMVALALSSLPKEVASREIAGLIAVRELLQEGAQAALDDYLKKNPDLAAPAAPKKTPDTYRKYSLLYTQARDDAGIAATLLKDDGFWEWLGLEQQQLRHGKNFVKQWHGKLVNDQRAEGDQPTENGFVSAQLQGRAVAWAARNADKPAMSGSAVRFLRGILRDSEERDIDAMLAALQELTDGLERNKNIRSSEAVACYTPRRLELLRERRPDALLCGAFDEEWLSSDQALAKSDLFFFVDMARWERGVGKYAGIPEEVARRSDIAKAIYGDRLMKTLDVSGKRLTSLPEAIRLLPHLSAVDVNENALNERSASLLADLAAQYVNVVGDERVMGMADEEAPKNVEEFYAWASGLDGIRQGNALRKKAKNEDFLKWLGLEKRVVSMGKESMQRWVAGHVAYGQKVPDRVAPAAVQAKALAWALPALAGAQAAGVELFGNVLKETEKRDAEQAYEALRLFAHVVPELSDGCLDQALSYFTPERLNWYRDRREAMAITYPAVKRRLIAEKAPGLSLLTDVARWEHEIGISQQQRQSRKATGDAMMAYWEARNDPHPKSELDLGWNADDDGEQLSSLSEAVGRLPGLRSLKVDRHLITALPETLADAKDLRSLDVSNNGDLRYYPLRLDPRSLTLKTEGTQLPQEWEPIGPQAARERLVEAFEERYPDGEKLFEALHAWDDQEQAKIVREGSGILKKMRESSYDLYLRLKNQKPADARRGLMSVLMREEGKRFLQALGFVNNQSHTRGAALRLDGWQAPSSAGASSTNIPATAWYATTVDGPNMQSNALALLEKNLQAAEDAEDVHAVSAGLVQLAGGVPNIAMDTLNARIALDLFTPKRLKTWREHAPESMALDLGARMQPAIAKSGAYFYTNVALWAKGDADRVKVAERLCDCWETGAATLDLRDTRTSSLPDAFGLMSWLTKMELGENVLDHPTVRLLEAMPDLHWRSGIPEEKQAPQATDPHDVFCRRAMEQGVPGSRERLESEDFLTWLGLERHYVPSASRGGMGGEVFWRPKQEGQGVAYKVRLAPMKAERLAPPTLQAKASAWALSSITDEQTQEACLACLEETLAKTEKYDQPQANVALSFLMRALPQLSDKCRKKALDSLLTEERLRGWYEASDGLPDVSHASAFSDLLARESPATAFYVGLAEYKHGRGGEVAEVADRIAACRRDNAVILDVSGKKVADLPGVVGGLKLREVHARACGLRRLPEELADIAELEVLDVGDNPDLERLPWRLNVTTLKKDERLARRRAITDATTDEELLDSFEEYARDDQEAFEAFRALRDPKRQQYLLAHSPAAQCCFGLTPSALVGGHRGESRKPGVDDALSADRKTWYDANFGEDTHRGIVKQAKADKNQLEEELAGWVKGERGKDGKAVVPASFVTLPGSDKELQARRKMAGAFTKAYTSGTLDITPGALGIAPEDLPLLSFPPPGIWRYLTHIRAVEASGANLHRAQRNGELAGIAELKNLEELRLADCGLTDALSELPQRCKKVDLTGNPLPFSTYAELCRRHGDADTADSDLRKRWIAAYENGELRKWVDAAPSSQGDRTDYSR